MRLLLLTRIEEKRLFGAPTDVWYIEAAAVAAVTVLVSATFTKVQAKGHDYLAQRYETE